MSWRRSPPSNDRCARRRRAFGPLLASRGAGPITDPRHDLGERGEEAVARWLATSGWDVLARRWRGASGGELDLVCGDPAGMLVAVEVKVRRTGRAGSGAESVDRRRMLRLRRAVAAYAAGSARQWIGIRVDLVTIQPDGARWRLRRLPGMDSW